MSANICEIYTSRPFLLSKQVLFRSLATCLPLKDRLNREIEKDIKHSPVVLKSQTNESEILIWLLYSKISVAER